MAVPWTLLLENRGEISEDIYREAEPELSVSPGPLGVRGADRTSGRCCVCSQRGGCGGGAGQRPLDVPVNVLMGKAIVIRVVAAGPLRKELKVCV